MDPCSAEALIRNLADLVSRSRLPQAALENLVQAGAVDDLPGITDRRQALWEIGVRHLPDRSGHPELDLPVDGVMADLDPESTAIAFWASTPPWVCRHRDM